MKLKNFLILMTLVAVVSDYLLHPFYPQFFENRFGITNPKVVGYYFAAICFMVMIAFPFWAYVSKKIAELNILVVTQLIAGILALFCYKTESYTNFWILSLVMILFKGSYLLVYPYILKIISKEEHPSTIGLLSVVVHLGGIMGAVIGGLTVDLMDPSYIFLIMALGDFVQMLMSLYLIKSSKYNTELHIEEAEKVSAEEKFIPKDFILKVGVVTLILYFSEFMIRPFFSMYWESLSGIESKFISGSVYAIPGFVALIALWINSKREAIETSVFQGLISMIALGSIGILLQGIPNEMILILGRIVFGWAIFQAVVKFDILLFELSTPEAYALDYSKVHFFQNLGVLLSSLSVGLLVENYGLQMPFAIAFSGFLITLILYHFLFKTTIKKAKLKLAKT